MVSTLEFSSLAFFLAMSSSTAVFPVPFPPIEMSLYDILKDRFENRGVESVAVFHSLNLLKFENDAGSRSNEKDFIIVSASFGYIMAIEVKKTLNQQTFSKSLQQLQDTKDILLQYLRTDIIMDHLNMRPEWIFIPMIYCDSIEEGCYLHHHLHIIRGKKPLNKSDMQLGSYSRLPYEHSAMFINFLKCFQGCSLTY